MTAAWLVQHDDPDQPAGRRALARRRTAGEPRPGRPGRARGGDARLGSPERIGRADRGRRGRRARPRPRPRPRPRHHQRPTRPAPASPRWHRCARGHARAARGRAAAGPAAARVRLGRRPADRRQPEPAQCAAAARRGGDRAPQRRPRRDRRIRLGDLDPHRLAARRRAARQRRHRRAARRAGDHRRAARHRRQRAQLRRGRERHRGPGRDHAAGQHRARRALHRAGRPRHAGDRRRRGRQRRRAAARRHEPRRLRWPLRRRRGPDRLHPRRRAQPVRRRGGGARTAGLARGAHPARATAVVDLRVDLGRQLRLRGRGLDTGLRGELHITSPNRRLSVNGTVSTDGGTYQAYGQKLTVDRGAVIFSGPIDNPRLDIEATRPNTDVRVGVIVAGTAANPRIRLFSEPDLPEVDKLSWLVLGRATEGLGRTDTALLQRAALALLSGEGEGMSDRVTRLIGLDDLSVRQSDDDARETVIAVGKQISQRWYVGYERGLNATAGSWQLIYRIAQRLTLRAQSGLINSVDVVWTFRWQ
ncbi:translocation/assembly module TamB domain-containing protein [Piscinibacter sakaiensis]|uniref:translocation/assembly module TamB domain-containing protein n=1 Tax=Piscinibacter sakaiensis TaxID=1547922 RepID=UPI00372A7373